MSDLGVYQILKVMEITFSFYRKNIKIVFDT